MTKLATPTLRERYDEYRLLKPQARMRDIATALGVSEGELVSTFCGSKAARLEPRWEEFLHDQVALGEVMVLTRNDAIVHEKTGTFGNISIIGTHIAQVVNHEVDLRIFLRNWRHAFAFEQPGHAGPLHSFQIFDDSGTAVLKIFLREKSDLAAFKRLVGKYSAVNQEPGLDVKPRSIPAAVEAPATDREKLRSRWQSLKDTHDFYPLLKEFNLRRRQAYSVVGDDLAKSIPVAAFESALREAAATSLPIMIFVNNIGCIQIHTGPVQRIEIMGPWLNVLDERFSLHVYQPKVAEAWFVRKYTADGVVTSIELFDAAGVDIALMFGERKPGRPELEAWRILAERLAGIS